LKTILINLKIKIIKSDLNSWKQKIF
jgi:hypothetical protein